MAIPLDKIANMPAFSPYYPMPPARYRNVRFHYVFFEADRAAIDRVLPECFKPDNDGLCAAIGISIPWSANYGAFQESVLSVSCTYEGVSGYFTPIAFLNSRSSIPAGREIYGTPKVAADITVAMDERVMYTDTRIAEASIFSIRSTMHCSALLEDMPVLTPAWRLKVIPRADGPGASLMQLIDVTGVSTDVSVHECRAGDGIVSFAPSPIYDLTDFAPRSYAGAYYVEMDYTEGYGAVVQDFLQ